MKSITPLAIQVQDTTVHASASRAARRLSQSSLSELASFQSSEEQREFFTLIRDWSAENLSNIERLGVPASETATGKAGAAG